MDTFLIVAAGAVLGGFVQGLSGFAFGMVAMSIWAWTLPPQMAATLAVFGAMTGQILAAVSVRRNFDWKVLPPFLSGGMCGLPIGLWLLPHLDMVWFKAILGTMLVLWCPVMLFAPHLPKITAGGKWADATAGLGGGVMAGIGGFSGPVPTLWCTLRGMKKDTQRTVIQNFNLMMLVAAMAGYMMSGLVTRDVVPLLPVVGLSMAIPTLLGARLYVGLSESAFRKLVLGVLTMSGTDFLASSLPTLLLR